MRTLEAVVTAGGTSEPIDDVRVLTNISTGRFGHAIADELVARGVKTTEICPKNTLVKLGRNDEVEYQIFYTADDLKNLLFEQPTAPDVIFQAAAVADYKPVRVEGKISSDQDELQLTLAKNPKIISELRDRYGKEAFIIGFKLLSNVSEEQLVAAALKQVKDNRLNLVVANDLQNLHDGQHPITIVTPEGGAIEFDGERGQVAKRLVDFVLKRAGVHWYHSEQWDTVEDCLGERKLFKEALDLAHKMNLFTDESGNVSASLNNWHVTVSPRRVDKAKLGAESAIPAHVDHMRRIVMYEGEHKPSIDTGVNSSLFEIYPDVTAMLHFHNGWGRMDAVTEFPYPCGVTEEAKELHKAIGPDYLANFSVELVHHGFLLGMNEGDVNRLNSEWDELVESFTAHVYEVAENVEMQPGLLRPIFDGVHVAGIIYDNPEGAAFYLAEQSRKFGLGKRVLDQLVKRKYTIRTVDDCNVRDFYKKHGFSESYDAEQGVYLLKSPNT